MEFQRSIQILPSTFSESDSPFSPSPTDEKDFDFSSSQLESGIELTDLNERMSVDTSLSRRRQSFALPGIDGKSRESWQFLGAAFILEAMIWGYAFSFGVMNVYLLNNEPFSKSSKAAIASVGTIALGLEYILPVVVILFFQKYPDYFRKSVYTAIVLNVSSMLLSSFATNTLHLILLQGVIGGASCAVLYVPVILWLNEWFVDRRGMASGLILSGTGLGGFVFPVVLGKLLDSVGFAWTVRVWSAISLVAFVLAFSVLKPRLPIIKYKNNSDRPPFLPRSLPSFKNPVLIAMLAATFFSGASYFPVSLYLPTFSALIKSKSPNSTLPSISLAMLNLCGLISQIAIGALSDRMNVSTILIILSLSTTLAVFLGFGFASNVASVLITTVIIGLSSGVVSCWSSVSRSIAKDLKDSNLAALLFFVLSISRGIASIFSPICASLLLDPSQPITSFGRFGFKEFTYFVGAMAILYFISAVLLGSAERKSSAS